MPFPLLPADGGCRCGSVRFRVTSPPLLTMACHCSGCQRMTGSAYSLSAAIPSDGFQILSGEPVIGGLHGADIHHQHCDWCKSWMFTTFSAPMGFVNVRATMFDDASWFEPFVETMTREALPWATTPATYRYEGFPEMEDYARLTAAYAAAQASDG
jgi:hypothetical protein